jgi:hypothetical protein
VARHKGGLAAMHKGHKKHKKHGGKKHGGKKHHKK